MNNTITYDLSKEIFINKYLRLSNFNHFKKQWKTYVDSIVEYRKKIYEYNLELHGFLLKDKRIELLENIKELNDIIDLEIKLLLNDVFQEILKDIQEMENTNDTYVIMENQFIDACNELIKHGFLNNKIYSDFMKWGDINSGDGDKVRIGLNKEFLENVYKKIF